MKASIFCLRVALSLVLTAFSVFSASAQSSDLTNDLRSSFKKFDVVRIDSGDELRPAGEGKALRVQTGEKNYELIVKPNDLRSSGYRADETNVVGMTPVERSPVSTYKGTIVGEPGSEVRLTIDGVKVEGFFQGADGRIFIEPASKYSRFGEVGDSVIYRVEDSLKDNTFVCESDIPGKIEFGRALADARRAETVAVQRVLELATEADLEWVTTLGGSAAANSEILSILNMAEGTYTGEVDISIRVVYQHTWTVADPFDGSTMNNILTNFVSYWNANFTSVSRDAAHLFSGNSLAQSRGVAYFGVVCRAPTVSYGLSGYVGWAPGKFLVPAHELGHNLGADHADSPEGCANTLMNPTLTGNTAMSFCPFSRNAITAYVSANNSCLSEVTINTTTAPFDFDGDARSDISVYRPTNGVWYLNRSGSGFTSFQFGLNGDKAVASDYDGDGKADAAVYRAGVWYRQRSSTNTTDVISFGLPGDIPTPGDFDGDDKADLAVFRPSTGVWYTLSSANGAYSTVRFGLAGDIPVTGDYDGDGKADINLFRPATGVWYRLNSSNGAFSAFSFGLPGDKPLAGNFDGDAKTDIAVWRPSSGVWYMMRSATGSFFATAFGLSGDVPAPADFDGDGKTDISVWRPSSGVWYRLNSGNGSFNAVAFGLSSDNPVPSYYLQ